MSSLIALPPEIINHIFSYADQETCKELALTCSLLSCISKRWFHCEARVSPYNQSCERFKKLSENKNLSRYTTKIYLDTSNWKPDEDEEKYRVRNGDTRRVFLPLPQRFMELFDCLREFPGLRSIVLCFPHFTFEFGCHLKNTEEIRQCIQLRSDLMKSFVSALSSLPRPPQELVIGNLQTVNLTDPAVIAMVSKMLRCLRSLRLGIFDVSDEGKDNGTLELEAHVFFSQFPLSWLQPAASNLQHLTLYSKRPLGFYPKLDLREIHFPQLKTLSFGNHTFFHDSQLDWILSHGATLTELYLDDCPILFVVAVYEKEKIYLSPDDFEFNPDLIEPYYVEYEKRWHDYFRSFKNGLPLLRHFRYGHRSTPFENETQMPVGLADESYMVFCEGYRRGPLMDYAMHGGAYGEPLKPSEEDDKALDELLVKTGQIT